MDNNQIKQILHLVVGGYLVYLAYDLFKTGQGNWLLLSAAAFFALAGGALIVLSLLKLTKNGNHAVSKSSEESEQ